MERDAEKEVFWEKGFLEVTLELSFERQMRVSQAEEQEGTCKTSRGNLRGITGCRKVRCVWGIIKSFVFQDSN